MSNVVYLVLVVTVLGQGVSVEKIPQANMKQCQINAKTMQDVNHKKVERISYKAHCMVGVK